MQDFSENYAEYNENPNGQEIADIDMDNDKLMYNVNKFADIVAQTARKQ
jgi:hypothetical protein